MRRHLVLRTLVMVLIALALPIGATAQSSSDAPSTISAHGYGAASAPADSATIQIVVGDSAYGGPPQAPAPGSTPGEQERRAVEPVIAALVEQGIPEGDIEIIVGVYVSNMMSIGGPATAVVRFTIESPSVDRIAELIDAATVGAAEERLVVGGIAVLYDVEDCAALEREARQMAIADAEERADLQAELLGVSRGDLITARDVPYGIESAWSVVSPFGPDGGCSPADIDSLMLASYSPMTFDPTAEPEVHVQAQIELTFEMESEPMATPAA